MSENWGCYFADMGGHTASIVFDDGISHEINNINLPMALRLKINLQEFREDGLPTSEEGKRIAKFDEEIEKAIINAGGAYLGRVTVNRVRWVMSLVKQDHAALLSELESLADSAKYQMEVFVEEDKEKQIYWKDLFPTLDDRRVMKDLEVLDVLAEHNDDNAAERPVNHWSYFATKESADKFAKSLNLERFQDIKIEEPLNNEEGNKTGWCVTTTHLGTMLLDDITGHTIELARLAEEAGGEYDGWETLIVKTNAA